MWMNSPLCRDITLLCTCIKRQNKSPGLQIKTYACWSVGSNLGKCIVRNSSPWKHESLTCCLCRCESPMSPRRNQEGMPERECFAPSATLKIMNASTCILIVIWWKIPEGASESCQAGPRGATSICPRLTASKESQLSFPQITWSCYSATLWIRDVRVRLYLNKGFYPNKIMFALIWKGKGLYPRGPQNKQ